MIEKAYAKASVNYINMDGGFQQQALRTLTGMPVREYQSQQQDDWSVIEEADSMDYTMTATCIYNINGLANYHAYTLLSVHELQSGVQLIRMRNPWGSETYNGPYSDGSDDWSDQDKNDVEYIDEDDGKFYMLFEDFLAAFPSYQIAMFNEDFEVVQDDKDVPEDALRYNMMNPVDQAVKITVDYPFPYVTPAGCDVKNDGNQILIMVLD